MGNKSLDSGDLAPVSVDEMVGLLQIHDPGSLAALRMEFPEQWRTLQPGITAGPTAEQQSQTEVQDLLRVKLGVKSSEAIVLLSSVIVRRASHRIDVSVRLNFTSRIISVAASSSLIAGLALQFPAAVNIISALATLASSLVPIASEFLLRTRGIGAGASIAALFPKLIEANVKSSGIADELRFVEATGKAHPTRIDEHLRSLNELAAVVKKYDHIIP